MTVFLLLSALFWALQPIQLRIDKRMGFPPLTVQAEVRIPRHVENRHACVVLLLGADPDPVDRSCWDVSGDSAPVFKRTWAHLWEGRYYAQARLLRGQQTYFSETVTITVAENP